MSILYKFLHITMLPKLIFLSALIIASTCYTTSIAHDLAYMSSIAYESQAVINAWSCSACGKFAVKNQKAFYSTAANIQGYTAYFTKENAIMIAFRGSVDFKNWVYNLNTAITGYPGCSGCSVHPGFYSAFKGVAPLVRTQVDQLKSLFRTAKLIVTGHSLGGAMAILTALDMKQLHGKVDYVYTYGQPRVGNANFAAFYQSQISGTYRVIDYADMVPHVPPSAFTFKHGGHEVWYNPRGMNAYKVCVSQDKACANSIASTAMSTDDHQMSYYITLAVSSVKQSNNLKEEEMSIYSDQQISQMEVRKVNMIKQLIGEELKQNGSFDQ